MITDFATALGVDPSQVERIVSDILLVEHDGAYWELDTRQQSLIVTSGSVDIIYDFAGGSLPAVVAEIRRMLTARTSFVVVMP
jgi:hypothetical protein